MSHRYVFETTTSGKQKFVKLKRSHSHHDHHHHRRHHHHHDYDHDYYTNYYMVRKEEWDILKERDRILSDNNKILTVENQDLRSNITDVQAEAHRLEHIVMPDLHGQITLLQTENAGLRRSLDNATDHTDKHHRDVEKLQSRVEKLEKENKDVRDENIDLRSRIRALNRQLDGSSNRRVAELVKDVEYWKEQSRHWKSRWEDLDRLYCDTLEKLRSRTERLDAYEEILKRRRII